jgi:hypothetical protein
LEAQRHTNWYNTDSGRAGRSPRLTQPVLPAFLPREVLLDQRLQRYAVHKVIKTPTRGRMPELNTAAIPSSRRRSPSFRACRLPATDSFPGNQPVARPPSLSSVVECVSNTTSIGMPSTLTATPKARMQLH